MRVTSHGNKKYPTTVLSEESSDDASTSDDASIEVTHVALQPTMKVFPSLYLFSLHTLGFMLDSQNKNLFSLLFLFQ